MELTLTTTVRDQVATEGEIDIDGFVECFTLELPFTDGLPGSAIPEGRFRIEPQPSPHFLSVARAGDLWVAKYAAQMPHINGIPGRSLIMLHWGDWVKDTDGCVLVGQTQGVDMLSSSRPAFAGLYEKIYQPMLDGNCFISVKR